MPLTLVPVGVESADICMSVGDALAQWVGLPVTLVEPVAVEVVAPEDEDGSAVPKLNVMVRRLIAAMREWPALGVTGLELRDVRGNVIRGFAERGGRGGFVSYAGLAGTPCTGPSGPRDWTDLLAWFALHEVGHLSGLGHCGAASCVMQKYVHLTTHIAPETPFCAECESLWEAERRVGSGGEGL